MAGNRTNLEVQVVDGAVGTQRIEADSEVRIVDLLQEVQGQQQRPAAHHLHGATAAVKHGRKAQACSQTRVPVAADCGQPAGDMCCAAGAAPVCCNGSGSSASRIYQSQRHTWGRQSMTRGTSSTWPYSIGETLMYTRFGEPCTVAYEAG
jgi:hypothetical protein